MCSVCMSSRFKHALVANTRVVPCLERVAGRLWVNTRAFHWESASGTRLRFYEKTDILKGS